MPQVITKTLKPAEAVQQWKKKLNSPKLKRRLIIVVILAVVGGILLKALFGGAGQADTQNAYTLTPAGYHTITSSLSGSGTLQPANSYTVTTLIEGEVLNADFEEGDIVEKDTILYQIDSSDAANNIEKSQISLNQAQRNYENALDSKNVKATISGSLYSLDVKVGDEITQGQQLAVIRESDTMLLTVPFPADDAETFYTGQTATVTLDNSFEILTGTVDSVSGSNIVGTGNMVTRNVTIAVQNPFGLGAEQSASANINGLGCAGSGTFAYAAESTITASVSGTVSAIHVQEGGKVAKNQIILTLDGDSLDDQIQSASDNLRNAELSMESTREQLDNYTITSPISGTIVDKQYKTGDTVEGGRTLCVVYDLSYLEMTMSIDELDIRKVSVGQPVQITADAMEGETYSGVITKVSVAGTTANGATSYPVTVRIDDTGELLPGMNVDAEIVLEQAENVLAIPNASVERDNVVLITNDSPSAVNALERNVPEGYVYVQVETGVSDNDYIQILGGIQEGDTVAYIPESTSGDFSAMFEMGGGPGGGPRGPGGLGGGPMG